MLLIHEIAQKVDLFLPADGADLHAWHDRDPPSLRLGKRCRYRLGRIVVGDGQNFDAQACCPGHQVFRRQSAIGRGGMAMQVDATWARGQTPCWRLCLQQLKPIRTLCPL